MSAPTISLRKIATVATDAQKQPLGTLELEDQPLIDLYSMRYYSGGSNFLAFDLGASPQQIESQLGIVSVFGAPFVVVADDQRIYLGALWTELSSIRYMEEQHSWQL